MKVYLAARFQNKSLLTESRGRLQAAGLEITSRWLDGDPQSVEDNASMDLADIDAADALVLYIDEPLEGERPMSGAWVEFGYALAKGKLVIVINAFLTRSIFVHTPGVQWATSWASALCQLQAAGQTARQTAPAP